MLDHLQWKCSRKSMRLILFQQQRIYLVFSFKRVGCVSREGFSWSQDWDGTSNHRVETRTMYLPQIKSKTNYIKNRALRVVSDILWNTTEYCITPECPGLIIHVISRRELRWRWWKVTLLAAGHSASTSGSRSPQVNIDCKNEFRFRARFGFISVITVAISTLFIWLNGHRKIFVKLLYCSVTTYVTRPHHHRNWCCCNISAPLETIN